ncbi:hypothetical protein PR202_ga15875 [Eleusine coracana subsp. coracana]|uniref:TCP domain-containing protein n=1 Tax=Eleusine coracana subsp. coracana TaxID=191504 RepID=A0AAV5CLE1_ELECO|nr:hypothetical protein PR202_ga15875 [Eleusine coracana subsp. coracana]
MLPYPNNQHHFGYSQDPPQPNPTASSSSFPMAAHPDQHHYDHHFFPGHGQGQYFNSETLEAVLIRPPPRAGHGAAAAAAPGATTRHNAAGGGGQAGGGGRARKRPFRTDRHSKIRTAQGVRDRRMRLSLDVARDFFALQDRLGFDKASKTVDWLLTQVQAGHRPPLRRRARLPSSPSRRRRHVVFPNVGGGRRQRDRGGRIRRCWRCGEDHHEQARRVVVDRVHGPRIRAGPPRGGGARARGVLLRVRGDDEQQQQRRGSRGRRR